MLDRSDRSVNSLLTDELFWTTKKCPQKDNRMKGRTEWNSFSRQPYKSFSFVWLRYRRRMHVDPLVLWVVVELVNSKTSDATNIPIRTKTSDETSRTQTDFLFFCCFLCRLARRIGPSSSPFAELTRLSDKFVYEFNGITHRKREGPTERWFVLVMKGLFALKTEMWITVPDGRLLIVLLPSTLRRLWNDRASDKDECCVFVENFVSRWLVLFQFMLESTNVERGSLSVGATRLTMAVEETGSNASLDESSRSELFSVTDNQYSLSYICAPSKGFSISVCACANSMRFG